MHDQIATSVPPASPGLHRFATILACLIVVLIAAGALVKSKEAGLSVPDWPLSYGSLNPPHWWRIDTVRAEHGHRMFAGTIALLTLGMAVWARRAEPRRWARWIAYSAAGAVLAQAILGGITVLLFLPPAVSIAHAGLAQLFLCLVTAFAVVTSPSFREASADDARFGSEGGQGIETVARLATATTIVIYLQILAGAVMRHNGAGLAIPTFPLAFGHLIPPAFTFPIAIHFTHRVGALLVLLAVAATAGSVLARRRGSGSAWRRTLALPALGMCALVLVQITLGALVVLTRKAVVPNTVHVATGAALLATSLALTLQSRRLARSADAVVRTASEGESAVATTRGRRPLEAAREVTS
ncbi:MAG TPA: COX15/CtaA family protein [Thermoanaerobaculia bacterium]|jgi:cytochrome c oxidase assembly protein subunit 15